MLELSLLTKSTSERGIMATLYPLYTRLNKEIEDFVSIFASDKDNPKLSQYILIDSRQLHETIILLSPTNSRKETNDVSFKGCFFGMTRTSSSLYKRVLVNVSEI